jgi:hypothetical protein
MSSTRRSANEVNILAMLDRHEAGGLPKRVLRGLRGRPATFWYGAAGVLAVGLLSVLAWLVRDSGAPSAVDTALASAVASGGRQAGAVSPPAAPPAAAVPDSAPDSAADPVAEAAPEAAAQGGATIVDVASAREVLPQAPAAAAALREPPRLARAAPRPATSKPAAAGPRAPAPAHAEPRARRTPAPPKAAPAPVDTDVALISAIIQHASRRQEAEEAASKP